MAPVINAQDVISAHYALALADWTLLLTDAPANRLTLQEALVPRDAQRAMTWSK